MDEAREDADRLLIILNDVVITTLSTIGDLGFDLEKGIGIMGKHLPSNAETQFADLKKWVEDFLFDINSLVESGQGQSMEQLIHSVKVYVEEHYRSGVTLNTMAAKLNMSPSQLSKLFLEYAGEHFSDYVTGLKVRRRRSFSKAQTTASMKSQTTLASAMPIISAPGSRERGMQSHRIPEDCQ